MRAILARSSILRLASLSSSLCLFCLDSTSYKHIVDGEGSFFQPPLQIHNLKSRALAASFFDLEANRSPPDSCDRERIRQNPRAGTTLMERPTRGIGGAQISPRRTHSRKQSNIQTSRAGYEQDQSYCNGEGYSSIPRSSRLCWL